MQQNKFSREQFVFAWQNKLYFQEKAEGIKEGKTCSILKFQQYGYFYITFYSELEVWVQTVGLLKVNQRNISIYNLGWNWLPDFTEVPVIPSDPLCT